MTPTPTAEERAKKALEFIGWGCGFDVCEHPDCPSCGCMAYLSKAIREAEDAAYDRGKADYAGGLSNCICFDRERYVAMRESRSLKSPKEV